MPKELSGEDVQAVRAKIGAAATALYAAKGADAITIRDIAKKLGCSPMGLYRYFADRDEILAFVRADAFNRFAERWKLPSPMAATRSRAPARSAAPISISPCRIRTTIA